MNETNQLTMNVLLLFLRELLLQARRQYDETLLARLAYTFDLLEDASFKVGDAKLIPIIEKMRYAVSDSIMGAEWKSEIPSEDEINDSCR